jgi:hypothetical protein
MDPNLVSIYSADPFASGGTADAYKRRLLAAQLLQKKASEDDRVYSNSHGGMKLATALLGGLMEGWEENKAKRGQAEGYDALLKMYTGGGLGGSGVSALSSSPSRPSSGSPAGAPSLAGGPSRAMSMPIDNPALAAAIEKHAKAAGLNPLDIATAMSYETGGTFDPWKKGPTTKWGTHRGLIQWGEPQARQYGVGPDTPVEDQVAASVKYLQDRGVKPGHGLMEIYSAINAGGVGPQYLGRSDSAAGGAPGTVADKVNNQMAGHRAKAEALMGSLANVPQADASEAAVTGSAEGFAVPNPGQDPTIMPVADAQSAESPAGPPPVQVASAEKGAMPINNPALAPGAPQPVTIAESPEAVHRAERAMNPEAFASDPQTTGSVAPPPPPMPPERPPEAYMPRAPRVPPQAMAQALMAPGGPQIDPNSNNAGAQQFAASGMGRGGQGMPQAPQQPPPQMPAQQAPSAPSGMYGGGAQPNAQYAQAGPAAQQPQLPQQQQVAQVTAQVAQAGGMTPQQLNEARRTLNNPHVPESVKSSLLQYIQKRFAPPTWKYENVPGYGLVAVNERDPNQTRDVRRVPESPTVVAEGGTAIDRSGKVIYQGGAKSTEAQKNFEYSRNNPGFDEREKEMRRAAAQPINVSTEKKGQELMAARAVEGMEKANLAAMDATKRVSAYGQIAKSMQGFTPGATAEIRLQAKALLKDLGIIGDIGVSDAEAFQKAARRLELAATPRGQGQITENERILIRETVTSMKNSPEGIAKIIPMLERLDNYDIQVAKLFRDSAKANGGIPNYLDVSERIAALGPPMSDDEKSALIDLKEGARPRQAQPEAQAEERRSVGGKNYFKRGSKWYEE